MFIFTKCLFLKFFSFAHKKLWGKTSNKKVSTTCENKKMPPRFSVYWHYSISCGFDTRKHTQQQQQSVERKIRISFTTAVTQNTHNVYEWTCFAGIVFAFFFLLATHLWHTNDCNNNQNTAWIFCYALKTLHERSVGVSK